MIATNFKRGFTLVELFVVLFFMGLLVLLLIPALTASREAERRIDCTNNMQDIGKSYGNYAMVWEGSFPPSSMVIKSKDGNKPVVGGWSFLMILSPYMDAFGNILIASFWNPRHPEDIKNKSGLEYSVKEFMCPSGPGRSSAPDSFAITNYKALGATTRDSLAMVTNPDAKPPYGAKAMHPDGALFPGRGLRIAEISDGLSHTIALIETVDQIASCWALGREATLVGLPQKSSPTGESPEAPYRFFGPPGFDKTGGEKGGVRTFLSYDFSPSGADAGKYEDVGFSSNAPVYGPSSMHPTAVMGGMCDGSVSALSRQIDAATFFFLITRDGNDPFDAPHMDEP